MPWADGTSTARTASALEAVLAPKWNDRGTVQYATTYNPGDVILYLGERILVTATFTTSAGTNGVDQPFISASNFIKITSRGAFWATDFGVVANGSTDDWAALQTLLLLVRSLTINSNNGFKVMLPTAQIMLSKTLIIPTQTMLVGQGLYSTVLKIMTGANCDVVQPERYNNAAQASILSSISVAPVQANLRNAFRWGLRDLCVHGNYSNQSPTGYYHGINAQTNPLTAVGTGDPDFDPQAIIQNVQMRACMGDGFYADGRSGMRLDNCLSWLNYGNGFTPSFDTQITACQAAFNGVTGFYHNHQSNQCASNKSYNNGDGVSWWTSGTTYAAASYVATATGLYYTAAGVVTSTVTPASAPASWTAVSGSTGGATSPQAWGVGVYVDSNGGEITMQCDSQQNSASNWYVRSTVGAVNLVGVSAQPNFGGSSQNTSSNNSSNPNSYAHLTLDNASGVVASLGINKVNAVTYALRIINGSANNDIRLAGDASDTFLSPDSQTLLGSTNSVVYNGVNKTVPQASFSNVFGDGSHGAATLDGTATVAWASKSGSTYTMIRDCFCTNLTINAGSTLIASGYKMFCTGTLTNNGTIRADGVSATSFAGGVGTYGGVYTTFDVGGTGGAGNTGAGSTGTAGGIGASAGGGGAGASGAGGNQGQGYSANFGWPREVQGVLAGSFNAFGVIGHKGGPGGGGGGGDGTNRGGGGGAGASTIAIFATAVTNTGTISAVGGAGFTPTVGNCGGGGGGAGGQVWIYTLTAWTNTGTTTLTGGAAGAGIGTGAAGVAGSVGAVTNYVLV